jgi:hypothetical protein
MEAIGVDLSSSLLLTKSLRASKRSKRDVRRAVVAASIEGSFSLCRTWIVAVEASGVALSSSLLRTKSLKSSKIRKGGLL